MESIFEVAEDKKDAIKFLNELALYIKGTEFKHIEFGNEILGQLEDKCIRDNICQECGSNDLHQEKVGYESKESYGIKDQVAVFKNVCSDCGSSQTEQDL